MNRADVHLSTEALAAYVDGELSLLAHSRASEHVQSCLECSTAVGVQRQTKLSLGGTGVFAVPSALLAKLSAIPFDADLDPGILAPGPMSLASGGGFEFSVAVPATPREPRRFGSRLRRSTP